MIQGRHHVAFLLLLAFSLSTIPSGYASSLIVEPSGPAKDGPTDKKKKNKQTDPPKKDRRKADPVLLSLGVMDLQETDLSIPSRGMDLDFVRCQLNGLSFDSALGKQTSFNWNQRIILEFGTAPVHVYTGPADVMGFSTAAALGEGHGGREIPTYTPPPPTIVLGAFYFHGNRIEKFTIGPGGWKSPEGVYAKLISHNQPGTSALTPESFQLRDAHGTIYTFRNRCYFDPFVKGKIVVYPLEEVEDRKGNVIRLLYDWVGSGTQTYRRLASIQDTLGRALQFQYDAGGRLSAIVDFTGRSVRYQQDAAGHLVEVSTPAVIGSSTGNDWPNGRTTRYQYESTSFPHAISSIIDPEEWKEGNGNKTPYLRNQFDGAGRVVEQFLGGTKVGGIPAGGLYRFYYESAPKNWIWFQEASRTLTVDPNGHFELTLFDAKGNDVMSYRFTGGAAPESLPTYSPIDALVSVNPMAPDASADRIRPEIPGYFPPLRPSDPLSYLTKRKFNVDSLLVEIEQPGSRTVFTFDENSADQLQKGNLLRIQEFPVPDDGSFPHTTVIAYEPVFNQIRAIVEPRGMDPGYAPQNGGVGSPARYMTRFLFDYQEGAVSVPSPGLQQMIGPWSIDLGQASQFARLSSWNVSLSPVTAEENLGDVNQDAKTDQTRGNAIQKIEPSVNVFVDIMQASPFFLPQPVSSSCAYNNFSLPRFSVDVMGFHSEYAYNPTSDPSGISGVAPKDSNGGFLRTVTLAKNQVEEATASFEYDSLGRAVRKIDARGFVWETEYNALDEIVRNRNPLNSTIAHVYDGNGNPVETRIDAFEPVIDSVTGLPTGATATLAPIVHRFEYDILNQLVKEDLQVSPAKRIVTKHRYDKRGQRVLSIFPEASNDPSNVVASIPDERGFVFLTMRAGLGGPFRIAVGNTDIPELASIVDSPLMSLEGFVYDLAGKETERYDGEAHLWRTEYDGYRRAIRSFNPLGHWTETSWDPANQAVVVRSYENDASPNGKLLAETRQAYDELGQIFQIDRAVFPSPSDTANTLTPGDPYATTRMLRDSKGQIAVIVDDQKSYVGMGYDALGRLNARFDSLSNMQNFQYDRNGNLLRTEEVELNSLGQATVFHSWQFYDKANRQIAQVNNLGFTNRFLYDSRGRLVLQSDAQGPLNGLLASLDSSGEHTPLPTLPINAHGKRTQFLWDDMGRPIETRFYLDSAAAPFVRNQQTFDDNSRLQAQIDDNGNATSLEYDALNRVHKRVHPDGSFETIDYDRNDRARQIQDPNGTRILNFYDDAGQLNFRSIVPAAGVGGGTFESYVYDGLSRVVKAANQDALVERNYDSLSRVLAETLNGKTTQFVYDGLGELLECRYPGGRKTQYEWDSLHRLRLVRENSGAGIAQYQYAGPSRLEKRFGLANGTVESVSYDGARRPSQIKLQGPAGLLDDRILEWDRRSNKTARRNQVTGVSVEYEYDAMGRLVRSLRTGAASKDIVYQLDGVGNRVSIQGGPDAGNYSMNAQDGPLNLYSKTPLGMLDYDKNGNLASLMHAGSGNSTSSGGPITGTASGWTISPVGTAALNPVLRGRDQLIYDYQNRLIEFLDAKSGQKTQYRYDVLGRRVAKITQAGTPSAKEIRYFYAGMQLIEEQDAAGQTLASYVFGAGIDEILSMRRGSQDFYYHADDQGSVVKLLASNGSTIEAYDYDDYGRARSEASGSALLSSPNGNPLFFTGRWLDAETGFYFYRSRYYSSELGRFLTRDPLGAWGDGPNRGNGFAYVGNNPASFIDPMGLARRGNTSHHGSASGRQSDGSDMGDLHHHGTASGERTWAAGTYGNFGRGDTRHHGSVSRGREEALWNEPTPQRKKTEISPSGPKASRRGGGYQGTGDSIPPGGDSSAPQVPAPTEHAPEVVGPPVEAEPAIKAPSAEREYPVRAPHVVGPPTDGSVGTPGWRPETRACAPNNPEPEEPEPPRVETYILRVKVDPNWRPAPPKPPEPKKLGFFDRIKKFWLYRVVKGPVELTPIAGQAYSATRLAGGTRSTLLTGSNYSTGVDPITGEPIGRMDRVAAGSDLAVWAAEHSGLLEIPIIGNLVGFGIGTIEDVNHILIDGH